MLGEFTRLTQQLDLAAEHLALGHLLDAEREAINALADRHGLQVPDPVALRRLGYRSAVIETYGALEDFVLDTAAAYANSLHQVVPRFGDLAERIRDNNFALSLRVLEQRERSMWRDRVEPEEMLARLLACTRTPDAYRLNEVAFREHTANLRSDEIQRLFTRLDIELARILDLSRADAHLTQQSPLSGLVRDTRGALDLLAERRNEIAHGSADTDILGYEILLGLVDAVRRYGRALHDAVLDSITTLVARELEVFGVIEHVFRKPAAGDGEIAGVRANGAPLSVRANDWVALRRDDGSVKLVRTRSIEVQKVAVDEWRGNAVGSETGGIWVERFVGVKWSVCPLPQSLRTALGLNVGA